MSAIPHQSVASGRTAGSRDASGQPAIELVGVHKEFLAHGDRIHAVRRLDLAIAQGEFFSLLGPSGCGKTTTMRMIAGVEEPTSGTVFLDGRDVTGVAPNKRDVNMVFQSYALFPHLSTYQNVAFGLERKKVSRSEIQRRVGEIMEIVSLTGMEKRAPREMSGGQQQRVALARALVNRPRALLLDEPLGALDLKLRQQMQVELKRIQREVGITFVYVTHDQGEALTMSDRIAVFDHGRIEQVGTPAEVYERPGTAFVAGFVGTSTLLTGEVARALLGRDGTYVVRPENVRIGPPGPDDVGADGTVTELVYAGPETRLYVRLDAGVRMVAVRPNAGPRDTAEPRPGDRVCLAWRREQSIRVDGGAPAGQATGAAAGGGEGEAWPG
jgi:spermidine/putrescine transport system ATP-binding protein